MSETVLAEQLTLEEGLRLAEEGMAAADLHADRTWRRKVDEAIVSLCRLVPHVEFTAVDVRRIAGDPPEGTHPNALGARFRYWSKRGLIRKLGTIPSPRPELHAHEIGIWIVSDLAAAS